MKKEYTSPKAVKLEFDYTDVITASNGGHGHGHGHGDVGMGVGQGGGCDHKPFHNSAGNPGHGGKCRFD